MKVSDENLDLLEKSLEGRELGQLIAILHNMHKPFPEETLYLVKSLQKRSDYGKLIQSLEFEVTE